MGNTEKTYEQYNKLIDRGYNFNSINQVQELIPYYESKGDKTRLIFLLQQLTTLEPKDPNNWNNLVNKLEEIGNYNQVLDVLKQWAEAIPASSSLTYQRYQEILNKRNATTTQQ
jgi:tetratricopeptide (TPR) repeat protein